MGKKKQRKYCTCGAVATYEHPHFVGESDYACDVHYGDCPHCEPIAGRDKYAHLVRGAK